MNAQTTEKQAVVLVPMKIISLLEVQSVYRLLRLMPTFIPALIAASMYKAVPNKACHKHLFLRRRRPYTTIRYVLPSFVPLPSFCIDPQRDRSKRQLLFSLAQQYPSSRHCPCLPPHPLSLVSRHPYHNTLLTLSHLRLQNMQGIKPGSRGSIRDVTVSGPDAMPPRQPGTEDIPRPEVRRRGSFNGKGSISLFEICSNARSTLLPRPQQLCSGRGRYRALCQETVLTIHQLPNLLVKRGERSNPFFVGTDQKEKRETRSNGR